jgi:thiol-disulfide isomerase/thioredoxin
MKFIYLIICFTITFLCYSQQGFELNVEVEDINRGKVELKLLGFNQSLWSKLKDGKVKITGELVRPTRVVLRHKDIYSRPFYIENSKMKITLFKDSIRGDFQSDKPHFVFNFSKLNGSLTNDIYENFKKFEGRNKNNPTFKYDLFNYLNEKIDQHPGNIVFVDIINELCSRQGYLNYSQLIKLLNKLDLTNLDRKSMITLKDNIRKYRLFSVGDVFPDENVQGIDGGTFKIRDFLAEYTLIDFWASWCKPCRAKNPKIKELYAKYHDKGFNVIGVSNDKYVEKLKLAIKKDDLLWDNFLSHTLYKDLLISSIPYTFLLDKNARIVGVNMTTTQIERFLNENLK